MNLLEEAFGAVDMNIDGELFTVIAEKKKQR